MRCVFASNRAGAQPETSSLSGSVFRSGIPAVGRYKAAVPRLLLANRSSYRAETLTIARLKVPELSTCWASYSTLERRSYFMAVRRGYLSTFLAIRACDDESQ